MLAAPILIDRAMTNYCAGVSGKGNIVGSCTYIIIYFVKGRLCLYLFIYVHTIPR
jgi:hypothetical protein